MVAANCYSSALCIIHTTAKRISYSLLKFKFGFVQDIAQNTMVKTHKYQEFENHKSTCHIICFGKNFLDIPNHTIKDPFILEFFQTQKMHTSEGLSIEQVVCIGATTPFFVS